MGAWRVSHAADPSTISYFKRIEAAALQRGERVTGAYGSVDGSHWCFTFAKLGRKAKVEATPSGPRRVARGSRESLDRQPATARQGAFF